MTLEAVTRKFAEIHRDLTYNVTRMYGREEILVALDWVFHSVQRFKFRKQIVNKGYAEGLILGDTKQGKSKCAEHLAAHYRAGEVCSAENTSYAGLVGGIQNMGKRNTVTWGKIPLNDRRLIVVDEMSGLSLESIGLLSGIRSSGLAEITKIITEKTLARTRLVWMANPRSGRRMDTYNYGVQAIKELFGKTEDISRLDFAIAVADGEVPISTMNRGSEEEVPHVYTSDLCSMLVRWAWTRASEDVVFGRDTEEAILDVSEDLGRKYSSQIPLVQAAEQRIKLARLSVATAARLFSTDDGERVVVKPAHVEFVDTFLRNAYDKPSMAYDTFSASVEGSGASAALPRDVRDEYSQFALDRPALTHLLLGMNLVCRSALADATGWDKEELGKFMAWAVRSNAMTSYSRGLIKTAAFTKLLRELSPGGAPIPFDVPDGEDDDDRPY